MADGRKPTRADLTRRGRKRKGPQGRKPGDPDAIKNFGDKNYTAVTGGADGGDPESTRAAMRFGRVLMGLEPVDLSDEEALGERLDLFFELCEEHNLRPMVTGLALALGVDANKLRAISRGDKRYEHYRGVTPAGRAKLQKAYEFLEYFLEAKLELEKGNPVKWFFLAKNHFGYTDKAERITHVVEEQPTLPDPEELEAKYSALVSPLEVDAIVETLDPETLDFATPDSATLDSEGG